MNLIKSAVACAALLAPSCAFAATQSFTYDIPSSTPPFSTTFSLQAFDTSLGTLTGVELELTNNTTASVQIINATGSAQAFTNAYASVSLTVTGPDGSTATAEATANEGSGTVSSFLTTLDSQTASATGTKQVLPADFGMYEGTSMVSLSYTAGAASGSYGGSATTGVFFGGSASAGGPFTVIYTYTAVPELSTWAMMGLGFAGLGFAGYRGRRAANI